jgi:hypothetical protein
MKINRNGQEKKFARPIYGALDIDDYRDMQNKAVAEIEPPDQLVDVHLERRPPGASMTDPWERLDLGIPLKPTPRPTRVGALAIPGRNLL